MDGLRVLVVDDEYWIRAAVMRDLVNYRVAVPDVEQPVMFAVDEADSGEEALQKIEAATPHIVLLDMKLPGLNGLDVLERLATAHPDVLTVMITAYASIETAVRATKCGAYDFLAKPFTPEELENVMQKAARHVVVAERARALAKEQRQVRFQFLSVLAHELKAPLNAIEGYITAIEERSAGSDQQVYDEMLRRCRVRTKFMRKLIVDLLDLTRIESGQKKRELDQVDLLEVARLALETSAPEAVERDVTIQLRHFEPTAMLADRNEIEMVFNNLVSNAVKYNKKGGSVAVDVARKGDEVTVSVADTGIGMTEEEAARLFDSFVRIKNEKTFGILGSGLGLAIVKKVAALYSGEVSVQSAPDAGSTFTVVLRDGKVEPSDGVR
ncbi:MAG: hybrid sensor histidine kinase/response regulator [Candidatus Hydrogenedentes bacterium]|nr:hybrid sensor histidine kinase/response regulator [Candidatus Hydrogenedentota bacterium]